MLNLDPISDIQVEISCASVESPCDEERTVDFLRWLIGILKAREADRGRERAA